MFDLQESKVSKQRRDGRELHGGYMNTIILIHHRVLIEELLLMCGVKPS